jgi:DNA-binding GntR family transcriptional regulator
MTRARGRGNGRPLRPEVRQQADRPVLRYRQVMDLVESLIADRGLRVGDQLPPSHELARLAGVSLISVRRALDELERAGRVIRHQGVGTFVASPRIVSEPGRAGGLLATLIQGEASVAVTTRLLSLTQGMPSPTIALALGMDEPAPVWQLVRLRLIGGRPTILERSVLPLSVVPELDKTALRAGGSLYAFLAQRYGLVDDYEEQYLDVSTPTTAERKHLALAGRDRVVRLRGVTFSSAGTPFDCFEQIYPASDFVFCISGRTSRHILAADGAMDWDVVPHADAPAGS